MTGENSHVIGDDAPAKDRLNASAEGDEPLAGAVGMTRFWRRAAGTAAIVALLIVGNATQATAAATSTGRATNPVSNTAAGAASRPAASAGSDNSAGDDDSRASAGSPLHGEFNVLNRDGSAQLRRWQSGQVDAIDSVSVTVLSADGFNSRYLLGPGVSVTGIGVGDE